MPMLTSIVPVRSQAEKLDQILRCAEVTTRYLCALAIASFAARENGDAALNQKEATKQRLLAHYYNWIGLLSPSGHTIFFTPAVVI